MVARSALRAVLVSLALAGAAFAGEFDDDDDIVNRASLFQPRVNETPEQVESIARELSMRMHAARFTQTDRTELGRLKRKEQELELRYRIAALRIERGFSRKNGATREVKKVEESIHMEKQKLSRMQRRHRDEAGDEKKKMDPFAMDDQPTLSPELKRRYVPEDRL